MPEETPPPAPETPPVPPPAPPDPEDALGEPGKRALAAERAARAAAEREAKDAKDRLAAIEAENQTESERAIAAARDEGRNEATTTANKRIIAAEVRAAAAGKLADPSDAALHLNLEQFEVGSDGSVDEAAIQAAIDGLVASKPYLSAIPAGPPPAGNPDAGARTTPPDKTLDEAIKEATVKGDLHESIRLKNLKLANRLAKS